MKASKLRISDALGKFVHDKFLEAAEHKSDTTSVLTTCAEQLRGITACSGGDDDVPITMNITAPMVRGVEGLLSNVVIGSSTSRTFMIKPTPEPELSDEDNDLLKTKVAQELQNILSGQSTANDLSTTVKNMEAALRLEQTKVSLDRASRLTSVLHDKLIESGWYDVQSKALRTFCSMPTSILKYPAVKQITTLEYSSGVMTPIKKLIRAVEYISPFNFFPSKGAVCPQTAEYVVEVRKANYNDLLDYLGIPGFDSDGVQHLLENYPSGYAEESLTVTDKGLEDNEKGSSLDEIAINMYDLLGYYGQIPGKYLAKYGVSIEDEDKLYESEIWSCAGVVIRATLNPHPLGKRPFYAASFEAIEGSFWGDCVTTKIAEPQRVCTAAVKAAIRNAAFSSGFVGEVDISRVEDSDDPSVIEPFTLKLVKRDLSGGGHKVYNFEYIKNITPELINLYTWAKDEAYTMLGLTKAAFGNSEGLGTVGRTSGGVAMILKRADHPIRLSAREYERMFIESILQDMIHDLMLYSEDASIRGDVQVYAIGVSGLVEQEKKASDLEWAMQTLSALANVRDGAGAPIIPPQAIVRLVYELFKDKGIPTHGILPDFEMSDALNTALPSSVTAATPETPQSLLDNRSGTALNELNSSSGGSYG